MNKEMNDKLIDIALLNFNKIELMHDTDFDDEMNEVDSFCYVADIYNDVCFIFCDIDYTNISFDAGNKGYYPDVKITTAEEYVSFVDCIRKIFSSKQFFMLEQKTRKTYASFIETDFSNTDYIEKWCAYLDELNNEAHKPLFEFLNNKIEEWKHELHIKRLGRIK
ncbi:hypothetical protein QTO12_05925 [Vibrio owensii]|uniref:hypothetical protein n=1 Tax=Vibrio owensii TaxID=696485 RepID=UPI002F406C93